MAERSVSCECVSDDEIPGEQGFLQGKIFFKRDFGKKYVATLCIYKAVA
jgi:hypothetical protein